MLQKALEIYKQAENLQVGLETVNCHLAWIQFQMHKFEESFESLEKVERIRRESEEAEQKHLALQLKALKKEQKKPNFSYEYIKARALLQQGKYVEALKLLKLSVEAPQSDLTDERRSIFFNTLAICYFFSEHDAEFENAIFSLEKAKELDKNNIQAIFNLGLIYECMQRAEALVNYSLVLDVGPDESASRRLSQIHNGKWLDRATLLQNKKVILRHSNFIIHNSLVLGKTRTAPIHQAYPGPALSSDQDRDSDEEMKMQEDEENQDLRVEIKLDQMELSMCSDQQQSSSFMSSSSPNYSPPK